MPLPQPAPDGTALVTGASSGIGDRFARALAARGHDVTVVARRQDRLESLATELTERHRGQVRAIAADLGLESERDRLAQELTDAGKRVDVLVNCAGFGLYRAFAENPRERELELVRLNVEAVSDLCARFLPAMVERGRGAIINIGSTAGFQALPYNASYAASKAFVIFLSEALSAELEGKGVTVTVVNPGPVPTEFQDVNNASFTERMPRAMWVSPERVVEDALTAVERGRRSVIPGGIPARSSVLNRYTPTPLALEIAKRVMAVD